ncbi:unnamed protein product [Kuraishia capsulata CBS 1993]|uniref:Uncharacterized protein n=1 Tax=Kuraishia capsulata CBS 1993 TaxID=1382522 RepID=W6MHX0_9ASCO|nr:uncharacterized protein KUCA_T00001388001 [Kuraishia capsulata CBS 1993]CDK25418.1 unnamed protein product [Kuraishia capsulata CBS 1993]
MRGSNSRGLECPADLKSAALDHSANPPRYYGIFRLTQYSGECWFSHDSIE